MINIDSDEFIIIGHLLGAIVAGGAIGLERSFHGRPAGFRTHTLVCLSSSLLMLITLFQAKWLPGIPPESVRMDPTRMAQGIMTGIGFLGAGVIYKENFNVRGLTTAASIWITAGIGILVGIGFYLPAVVSTLLALGILSLFRRIEALMPSQVYAHYAIGFDRDDALAEDELRTLLQQHGFAVASMGYRIGGGNQLFEYQTVIRTSDRTNIPRLAATLRTHPKVRELRIMPSGS